MSQPATDAAALSIVVGAALREARHEAGLRCSDIATTLKWSVSKVSRIETGMRAASDVSIIQFATLCGMPARRRDHILDLAAVARAKSGHWLARGEEALRAVRVLEAGATDCTFYSATAVPALLQTRDYSLALTAALQETGVEPEEALARQRAFARNDDKNRALFLVHEAALRLPVGGHLVMAEQVEQIARIGRRFNRRVLVVPLGASGAPETCGGFTLLTGAGIATPVVLARLHTSVLVLDRASDWAAYRSVVSALVASALPEDQSRALLGRLTAAHRHRARETPVVPEGDHRGGGQPNQPVEGRGVVREVVVSAGSVAAQVAPGLGVFPVSK